MIELPIVLYRLLKVTPWVLWMVIVKVRAVIGEVLASTRDSSLYQPERLLETVAVRPPPPELLPPEDELDELELEDDEPLEELEELDEELDEDELLLEEELLEDELLEDELPEEETVKPIVAVCVSEPLTPVMVTFEVPMVAVLLAAKVATLVAVVGFVPKVAVTPVGSPLAFRVTLPAKPLSLLTVMVEVAVALRATETREGLADNVKSAVVAAVE